MLESNNGDGVRLSAPASGSLADVPTDDDTYGLPPILNAEQAAEFLGVNVKTLYKAVADGTMPGKKIGHRTVILRDALLEWLRTQERVRTRRGRSRR